VIHAAGDTSESVPLETLDPAAAERQFRGKARGLIVLDELLDGRELDFFMVVSSLSSVLGGIGLAAYAAANTFLDAYAQQRSREAAVPWISVNWDAWQFSAEAVDGDSGEPPDEDGDSAAIWPEEGADVFARVLERAPPQIVVSTTPLAARLGEWVDLEGLEASAPDEDAQPAPAHPRPEEVASAYVAPRTDVERTLASIWEQLLGIQPIGVFDNFFELGGHSLLAIQLISRIADACHVGVSIHRVFDSPTVAELAELVQTNQSSTEEGDARTAELLDFVEQLSETEVQALLEQYRT
jgi:hypothetical protein